MGNVTAKTSGEIASFMTPAETNIKSLKVHFSPKQLGEGDPSPENVREIVGWGGVELHNKDLLIELTPPTEVASVYGGTVDLITGEIIAEWVGMKKKLSEAIKTQYDGIAQYDFRNSVPYGQIVNNNTQKCNIAKYTWNGSSALTNHFYAYYNASTGNRLLLFLLDDSGVTDDTEVTYIASLQSPVTIQSESTQELKSFIGQNNIWSNADYVEVEYDLIETEDIQKARKRIILNAPHIESTKGDLATFQTDLRAPLKECKVYFEPIQEGSGDPSPDNVRNIIGWDGVEVTRCGKNLFDISKAVEGYLHYYGTSISTPDAKNMTSDFIPVCEGDILSYQVYPTEEGKGYWTGYCFYGSQNMTDTVGIRKVAEGTTVINNIIVPAKAKYIRIGSRYLKGGSAQLESSATTTQYEQYQGETKTINWADEVGTVYGGYIDLVKGELVETNVAETFTSAPKSNAVYDAEDSIYFTLKPSYPFISIYSSGTIVSSSGVGTAPRNGLCNRLKIDYIDNWRGTQYINSLCSEYMLGGFSVRMSKELFNLEDEYTEQEKQNAINEYLSVNPIIVYYELKTPIHYQLTPQQLLTFKGTNNIWSNSNSQIETKFWTYIHNESESDKDDSTSNIIDVGLADSMILAS